MIFSSIYNCIKIIKFVKINVFFLLKMFLSFYMCPFTSIFSETYKRYFTAPDLIEQKGYLQNPCPQNIINVNLCPAEKGWWQVFIPASFITLILETRREARCENGTCEGIKPSSVTPEVHLTPHAKLSTDWRGVLGPRYFGLRGLAATVIEG